MAEIIERVRAGHPGLVGQDVKAGVVQPTDRRQLAVVPAGEHHHVAGPLGHQALERPLAGSDVHAPGGGALGALVERVDQGEEIVQLGALRGVHHQVVPDLRVPVAEGERGVEVAGSRNARVCTVTG